MPKRVVELGYELTSETFYWPPDGPPLVINPSRSEEPQGWGYELTELRMSSHMGTHCDAPSHLSTGDQERTLSYFRDERLVSTGVVLDIPKRPLEGITAADCEGALSRHGRPIPEQPTFLLNTGFADGHREDCETWMEKPTFIHEDAARWLVAHGAGTVGIDSSGFDAPGAVDTRTSVAHNVLLGAGVLLLEELHRIDEVDWEDPLIVVAPLPIKDGDGAPCRVLAIEL